MLIEHIVVYVDDLKRARNSEINPLPPFWWKAIGYFGQGVYSDKRSIDFCG